ncbi:uncharacterized protein [Diabrotica undecimpunctata]|uniref:uncharacterized protein n=1 Tax=Diabrotica undecimpunctata TaxID=50387 RepID=UPI003B63F3D8
MCRKESGSKEVPEVFRGDSESKRKVRGARKSGGLKTERRKALHSVVQSIVLYAAPVWSSAVLTKAYRKQLTRANRKSLLRVACAYRIVSAEALGVIAGRIPMHMLVKERGRIYERRNEDKSFIPNLRRWMNCGHRRLDYFLAQMLTGHGCFRAYFYRLGKAENDKRLYCEISDIVSHTLLVCDRWIGERSLLERELGSRVQSSLNWWRRCLGRQIGGEQFRDM